MQRRTLEAFQIETLPTRERSSFLTELREMDITEVEIWGLVRTGSLLGAESIYILLDRTGDPSCDPSSLVSRTCPGQSLSDDFDFLSHQLEIAGSKPEP